MRSDRIEIGLALVSLAIPIMASNILGVLDGLINAMWVGRCLGDAALAAASNVNTVVTFIFSTALGISTALTIQIAFCLGDGTTKDVAHVVRAAWTVFTLLGILTFAAGEGLCDELLRALEVPPESVYQAEEYLRWILASIPISYLFGMIIAALRGAGNAKTPFYFCLLSIGLDGAFNPLLIFGIGPIPHLGIKGAALATVLSQGIGLSALIVFLFLRGHFLCLPRENFVVRGGECKVAWELIRRGGPIGVELLSESLLAILMMSLVNKFGTHVTAAFGAVNQLWNCVMMPSMAVSLAAIAMTANSFGAGDWMRVKLITRLSVVCSLVSAGALLLVLELTGSRTFALFLPAHSPALAIADNINRLASWSCLASACCSALIGTPRAAGAVWGPFTISMGALVLRFVLAEALLRQFQVVGIWVSFPISGAIAVIGTIIYYRSTSWSSAEVCQKVSFAVTESVPSATNLTGDP